METLIQIFAPMMGFLYHCFDRIVINGYISMLSRPENVVYFFRNILDQPCISKEALGMRTKDYNKWVDSYARNHGIPLEWAEKKVRKEDYVRPNLKGAVTVISHVNIHNLVVKSIGWQWVRVFGLYENVFAVLLHFAACFIVNIGNKIVPVQLL